MSICCFIYFTNLKKYCNGEHVNYARGAMQRQNSKISSLFMEEKFGLLKIMLMEKMH